MLWGTVKHGLNLLRGYLRTIHFDRRGRVAIAKRVAITKNKYGRITLGHRVAFAESCGIAVMGTEQRRAELTIGDRTTFQPRVKINCMDRIRIGDDCTFSWDVDILDYDFHSVVDLDGHSRPNHAEIWIQDRVWVGLGVKILKGVTIGHDSVVAAGAVVTRSIPPKSLAAGSPARVVKSITGWKL